MVRRHDLWVSTGLLFVIVAGLVIQWPERGLWYDETVNAYFAEQSWSAIWEWCTQIDNQVPLHFALLKLWGDLAGTGEFALRTLSFFCAVLSIGGLIALGRRIGGRGLHGWLASAALALTQSFLYAVFEVRPYALALVLFVWSSVFLWELWQRYAVIVRPLDQRYWRLLGVYLLLAVALLYTHYTSLMALAAHGIYLGWQTVTRRERQQVTILAHLAAGLVIGYLPWVLALAGRDVRAGTAYEGRIAPDVALRSYVEFFAYGQQLLPNGSPSYAGSIAALVVGSLALSFWVSRNRPAAYQGATFAAAITVIPLAGLVVMVYAVQAKLSGRHGWMVWLGAALLIGLGLATLDRLRWARWPLWAGALLVIWLPASAHLRPVYDSDLREAFAYVRDHAQPGDALVLRDGTLFTAAGYYDSALPWIGLPPDKLTDVDRTLFFAEAVDGIADLLNRENARRVWVIAWQGHIMDPQDLIAGILEYAGEPQPIDRPFGDVFVSLYVLHDHPRSLKERVQALEPVVQTPPDGPVYYGGYVLDEGPVPHGGAVIIHTWWQRGVTVMPDMRVSVRLYDPTGNFYTQLDQPPVAPSFGQEHWQSMVLSRFVVWVPYEIPPGPAEVKMLIYDMGGTFEPIPVTVAAIEIGE